MHLLGVMWSSILTCLILFLFSPRSARLADVSSCLEGEVKKWKVGHTASTVRLYNLNTTRFCQWELEGERGTRLVIKMVQFSGALGCSEGNLTMYDGTSPDTRVEVGRWCGYNSTPFSTIYSSDSNFLLTISLRPPSQRTVNVTVDLTVHVTAVPNSRECEEDGPVDLQLEGGPLYFPSPFTYMQGRVECTIRVHHEADERKGFRVDVLTTGARRSTCEDNQEPAVWVSDGKRVHPECWRGSNPVYWTETQQISVLPRKNVTSFLRVQLMPGFPCTGSLVDNAFFSSHYFTAAVSNFAYHRNVQCQFVIRAENDGDHPAVVIRANFLGERGCADVLTIYNGTDKDGQLLFRFCSSDEYIFGKTVVSPSNAMLVVLSTDDDDTFGDDVDMQYYSVPETDMCEEPKRLYATTSPQILQSPNFPSYYPLNYDCFYYLRTNLTKHALHVNIISMDFNDSSDFLDFVDHRPESILLARMSRSDRIREFTSTNQTMTVHFISDHQFSTGGWQLEYRAVSLKEDNKSATFFQPFIIIIVVIAVAVVLVVIIVVVIIIFRRKNKAYSPPPENI